MKKCISTSALFLTFVACSPDEKSTEQNISATPDAIEELMLDDSELNINLNKAEKGDSDAALALYYHYDALGDHANAEKWGDLLLSMRSPEMIRIEIDRLQTLSESSSSTNAQKTRLLGQALELNNLLLTAKKDFRSTAMINGSEVDMSKEIRASDVEKQKFIESRLKELRTQKSK